MNVSGWTVLKKQSPVELFSVCDVIVIVIVIYYNCDCNKGAIGKEEWKNKSPQETHSRDEKLEGTNLKKLWIRGVEHKAQIVCFQNKLWVLEVLNKL